MIPYTCVLLLLSSMECSGFISDWGVSQSASFQAYKRTPQNDGSKRRNYQLYGPKSFPRNIQGWSTATERLPEIVVQKHDEKNQSNATNVTINGTTTSDQSQNDTNVSFCSMWRVATIDISQSA